MNISISIAIEPEASVIPANRDIRVFFERNFLFFSDLLHTKLFLVENDHVKPYLCSVTLLP